MKKWMYSLPYTNKITVAGDVGNMFNLPPLKMFDYLASGKL